MMIENTIFSLVASNGSLESELLDMKTPKVWPFYIKLVHQYIFL